MNHFLSIHWDVNPEIFSLGSIHLRYYGVLLVSGFVIAYFVLRDIFRREHLSQQLFDNFAIVAVVSTLIGLRLGHFLFYEPEAF
ncbi:MAG: prolipoprotein diacylglyceryl transferase, partial [Prevotellaceae bacterium]|nr:prolipoprotein diacylglyceryl transferase [Prevotellaceae bacterium]